MNKVSYPNMGSYSIPVYYLLTHVLENEVLKPKEISSKTLELGSRYSPDFVCTPFKYTLGTLLEDLEDGATTLLQMGGGCRYGYYHELQEQIIKDLGYECELINLISGGNPISIKKLLFQSTLKVKKKGFFKYFRITKKMVLYMDQMDHYIRRHRCYEKVPGSLNRARKNMLQEFSHVSNIRELKKVYRKYKKVMEDIPVLEPVKRIRIGLIGELYTLMEPASNEHLEELLNAHGFEVRRYTDVTYLLFQKKKKVKKYLKNFFIKYRMGADALDNIHHTKELCEEGFDGIIHIKSSFCTPEIAAMPIIEKTAKKYHVPVLFLSMDMNTSETGFLTRIEAFCDMLEMRNL